MTRIERPLTPTTTPNPGSHAGGRLLSTLWRSNRWLRRLIGLAFILLIIASVVAYFGIANIPVISQIVYRPIVPIRPVLGEGWSTSIDALGGSGTINEGQLTTMLKQLDRLPGTATVFYDLQAVVESGKVQVNGRLFQSNGYYRFVADAEPVITEGHLAFAARNLRVQKINLPASYIQPLFNQLATVSNGAMLNAYIQNLATESSRINLTFKSTSLR
ncbi:MAG: hypothetical protein WC734_02130 [Patescibacteria group bacterium]|jgi:hypothetical protein